MPNHRIPSRQPGGPSLSRRQVEVLTYLALGLTTKEAARRAVMSYDTANAHIRTAKKRLGVHTRVELLAQAVFHGFISPPRVAPAADEDTAP